MPAVDVRWCLIPHIRACRQLYSAEPVWEEPEDLRTMLDESTFEVTEEMVRSPRALALGGG
jgi:hypothetical protein